PSRASLPSLPSNRLAVKGKSLIYMSFLQASSGRLGGWPVKTTAEWAKKQGPAGFLARRPRLLSGWRLACFLGFLVVLLALLGLVEGRAQDVAQAGARVGRTELGHRLLVLFDLASLDRQGEPAALRVD